MLVLSFGQGTAVRSESTVPSSNLVAILRPVAQAPVHWKWFVALVHDGASLWTVSYTHLTLPTKA